MCQFSTWKAFLGSAKHCGINFRIQHFNMVLNKICFYKEPNQKQKYWATHEITAKNGYLYEQFSQKLLFKVQKSFNKRMIKKLLSLSENLFIKTAFLTFAFRSKWRVNKSISCKKKRPRENQYSSSSRKKPRAPQYSSAQLTASQL